MFGPLSCYCCIFGWAFKEFHSHFMVICYISGIFQMFLARNSCMNVVTQKLFLKSLQNSIKVPMCKLELYLCRENIDFLKIWNMSMKVQMSILKNLYNIFFSLYFWYDVDKTRQQHNQSLVNLRSYNHLHQP